MSATVVRIPTSDNTISAELQNKIDKAMKEYENGETLHFENISEMNQWLDALWYTKLINYLALRKKIFSLKAKYF